MLRYRAVEHHKGLTSFADKELAKTDSNGKLGTLLDDVANIATKSGGPMRGVMQSVMGLDKRAHLPNFADVPLTKKAAHSVPAPNPAGPGFGKQVVLYAPCYGNFNDQTPGNDALKVVGPKGVPLRLWPKTD